MKLLVSLRECENPVGLELLPACVSGEGAGGRESREGGEVLDLTKMKSQIIAPLKSQDS